MEEEKDDKKNEESRVFGNHKQRDLWILQRLGEGYTQQEVLALLEEESAEKLTKGRISQIVEVNREFLDEITHKMELAVKAGRLRKAFQLIRKMENSKKDPLDILEYIRKEMQEEGGGFPQVIKLEIGIPTPFTKEKE